MEEKNNNRNKSDETHFGTSLPVITLDNIQYTIWDAALCGELATAIERHFRNLQKLIKVTKTKDDSISLLSSELQKYRSEYCSKLIKPLATALINFREGLRKYIRDMQSYSYSRDDIEKYISFISDEYAEVLSCQGIVCEDGTWTYSGKPLRAVHDVQTMPALFEYTAPEEDSEEDSVPCISSFEDVVTYLDSCEQKIRDILADNDKIAGVLGDYIRFAGYYEKDVVAAGVMPIVRRMTRLSEKIAKLTGDALSQLSDENCSYEYEHILSTIVFLTEGILAEGGVTIYSKLSDEFDPKVHRLLKKVQIADESEAYKDKKIAAVHTECYILNDTVIYPSKVDVYVYEKKN